MPDRSRTLTRGALLLGLVLAPACAHGPRREVSDSAAALRCEEASSLLEHQPRPSTADQARRAVTAPLSYLATGAGAVGAAAVLVPSGVIVGALICSPVIALDAALKGDGELSGECVGGIAGPLVAAGAVGAGEAIYRSTRTWRCVDRSRESRETRAVARCYAERRWLGDLDVARTLLVRLREPRIYGCLPGAERRAIDTALSEMPGGDAAAPEP
jgi:hypothetical protein